jgi:hypothetical protein
VFVTNEPQSRIGCRPSVDEKAAKQAVSVSVARVGNSISTDPHIGISELIEQHDPAKDGEPRERQRDD